MTTIYSPKKNRFAGLEFCYDTALFSWVDEKQEAYTKIEDLAQLIGHIIEGKTVYGIRNGDPLMMTNLFTQTFHSAHSIVTIYHDKWVTSIVISPKVQPSPPTLVFRLARGFSGKEDSCVINGFTFVSPSFEQIQELALVLEFLTDLGYRQWRDALMVKAGMAAI